MAHDWPGSWTGPYLEVADVRRIAVFRALHLGDFLCSVPALRALKGRYPEAEITLIGLPWVQSLLNRYPCVDRFLEFPGYRGLEGVLWAPVQTERFCQEARFYGYDLAVQMHGDGRVSNGFVAQLGARASLGYRPEGADHEQALDLELAMDANDHEIVRWLRLVGSVRALGGTTLEFPLTEEDWIEAEDVARRAGLDPERPVVVLHPGARDPDKRWPPERFGRVGDLLSSELGAQVAITGAGDELQAGYLVAAGMRNEPFVLAGRTSLGGLAALMARARLVVTNDTGPSHLAAAVGAPSVVLFGPTDPARWAPLDSRAHRFLWGGPGAPIESIPVEAVMEEALALVERCAYLTF